ncbi:hypothetical protein K458DRAFT_422224 [Lentithecium fluviatile CBS 122367]|uniref:Uncharacterized protein n=1 Tax=Lentithecium fluviatile CBS 122367 TaxID=1168545 RepID=A0A6G1INF7_9PLEO|nr:hypothetical protein K458DRAFT_422224 [Lentithecium fluviatile CBS 122367]
MEACPLWMQRVCGACARRVVRRLACHICLRLSSVGVHSFLPYARVSEESKGKMRRSVAAMGGFWCVAFGSSSLAGLSDESENAGMRARYPASSTQQVSKRTAQQRR